MVGRDLAEHVGVVDDGAEIVDRLQREPVAADIDERGVVRRVETDDDIVARGRFDRRERAREHGRADLGAAAAATHGNRGNFPERLLVGNRRDRCRRCRHFGEFVEFAHEAAVDPVLPAPHPFALDRQAVAGTQRITLPGRDQIKRLTLRAKWPQRLPDQCPANIIGEHRAGTHGIDARLRQVAGGERDGVAGREHIGMACDAQGFVDLEKATGVERQPGLCQPVRRRSLRGPKDLISLDRRVAVEHQPSGLDAGDGGAGDDGDAALGENGAKTRSECRRKARQDLGDIGHEDERQSADIETGTRDVAPQPTFDREQELDAAGTGADQRHARASLAYEHASHERLEPAEEAVDRLDRNGVLACARHIGGIRGRADIEREQIVRDRRATTADHVTAGEIKIDHFVLKEPCPGKTRQRTGVDVGVVDVVMAGDKAGQHA